MYLNKIFILGNLTRDPELRSLPSGIPVASFSVATNRVWRDKDGNKQESSEFHNIVVFSRQGELAAQYLKRGQTVLVEGRLQTRSWDDQSGQKKYRTEIIADRVQFGPKAGGAGPGGGGYAESSPGPSPRGASTKNAPPPEEVPAIEYPEEEASEDIPF
jgi:single-strand DNA-binding protein